jgi:hypothetical protein
LTLLSVFNLCALAHYLVRLRYPLLVLVRGGFGCIEGMSTRTTAAGAQAGSSNSIGHVPVATDWMLYFSWPSIPMQVTLCLCGYLSFASTPGCECWPVSTTCSTTYLMHHANENVPLMQPPT